MTRVALVLLLAAGGCLVETTGHASQLRGGEPQKTRRRILVVQIDDRNLSAPVLEGVVPFWKYSQEINKQYAANHGYDYRYISFKDVPEGRHFAWAHVAEVRDILAGGEYDYVMKLDSDAMLATTAPLESMIDFGPFDRGEKDVALGIDAMYYDLYECPRVHNLTAIERVCDADSREAELPLEALKVAGAERCSSWFSVEAWRRGLHLGELRGVGNDELEEKWLESWATTGVSELPPGATRRVFDRYGLSQRRKDLLDAKWMHDPDVTPAMAAFGAFNSGVYLAKASAASVALFDDWWALPSKVCQDGAVAPSFEPALRRLTSGEAASRACPTAANGSRNAFTLRPNALAPLSCADGSLQDYLSGRGAGGSPLYEQPALSLVLPAHMSRVEAYDAWEFNGAFSRLVWHPVGPAKTWHETKQWFDVLLERQRGQPGSSAEPSQRPAAVRLHSDGGSAPLALRPFTLSVLFVALCLACAWEGHRAPLADRARKGRKNTDLVDCGNSCPGFECAVCDRDMCECALSP